jgi:plastocyanin
VSDHVITLTSDGFTPAELTIARGETVTFRTTTGKRFWPASNLHPSHLEYADFDPRQPIEPDGAWSFTFDKPGVWRMHDHLAPYYTGTITVTE